LSTLSTLPQFIVNSKIPQDWNGAGILRKKLPLLVWEEHILINFVAYDWEILVLLANFRI
jgi:hypothetical protein